MGLKIHIDKKGTGIQIDKVGVDFDKDGNITNVRYKDAKTDISIDPRALRTSEGLEQLAESIAKEREEAIAAGREFSNKSNILFSQPSGDKTKINSKPIKKSKPINSR